MNLKKKSTLKLDHNDSETDYVSMNEPVGFLRFLRFYELLDK